MWFIRPLGAFLLVLAAIAGCSQPMAGVALPDPAPKRPRVVNLQGKEPCSLLQPQHLVELKIDGPGRPGQNEVLKSAPQCLFAAAETDLTVTLVTTEGVEAWAPGKRLTSAVDQPPIAGFPAKSVVREMARGHCELLVDVSDGQYLRVEAYVWGGTVNELPQICASARQLAEAAMVTLLAG